MKKTVVHMIYDVLFRDTCPMILVANKIDLVHQRKIYTNQGEEMAQKLLVNNNS